MKLAEALNLRADRQKSVERLQSRIVNNMKVQEGDKPMEQPVVLFSELDNILTQLEELVVKINLTNAQTMVDGMSMTRLLSEKDMLKKKLDVYRSAYSNAVIKNERYSRNEVKFVSTVDGEGLQKKIDSMSKQYRELDMRIQQANWSTELQEQ